MVNLKEKKMHFPFEYIDSHEKLDEEGLPSDPHSWFNCLRQKCASPEIIREAQIAFARGGCKSLRDYLSRFFPLSS